MAVTEVKKHSEGASSRGSGTDGGSFSYAYRAKFHVICDSPLDGPPTINEYFRAHTNLPFFGRTFEFANGIDRSAICREIDADYIPNSEGKWVVTATFEPIDGPSTEDAKAVFTDENGKPSEDPMEWHEEIDVSFTQVSAPVEQATFRGFVGGGGGHLYLKPGKSGPIVNSAMVPFDPTIEEEVKIKVIRIVRSVLSYDGDTWNPWIGAVNTDHVIINKPAYNFKEQFSPYVGKIENITATFGFENGYKHYRLGVELHINPLGWRRQLCDRGISELWKPGDKLPDGTILSPSDFDANREFEYRNGSDPEGEGDGTYPLVEPVNFDGNGHILDPSKPPVYMEWSTKHERPFAGFPW